MENFTTKAIGIVGITKLTTACGLASRNAVKKWEVANRIPLDANTNYPAIIEKETGGQITSVQIWRQQLSELKPGIVYNAPVALFRRDPDQPRKHIPPEHVESLAAAILVDGQESPIKFRIDLSRDGSPLLITHGECRWRAVQHAGLETIDCTIDTVNDSAADRIFRQAADNNGRPLSHWDWACTFKQLHDEQNLTDQVIADKLEERGIKGFSRPVIANLRRLFNLPGDVTGLIMDEWLTPSHGKYLLQIKHQAVLKEISRKLAYLHRGIDREPPNTAKLREMIRDAYIETYTHLETVADGATVVRFPANFDIRECDECKDRHTTTVADGRVDSFCTNNKCYLAKQEATEKDKRIARGQSQEAEKHPQKAPATEEQAPAASQKQEPALRPTQHTQPVRQTPKKPPAATDNYLQRLHSAINGAPAETLDAILIYCASPDDELTLEAINQAIAIDPAGAKRNAAKEAVALLTIQHTRLIGRYLNVPGSPATSGQVDMLAEV